MKKVLIGFVLVGVLASGVFVGANTLGQSKAQTVCPPGSYAIDEGICKKEPTGCPYGDSIPLDSPKCVPHSEEEIKAAEQPPVTPAPTENSRCQ